MKNLTTDDFLIPIRYSTSINTYKDVYVLELYYPLYDKKLMEDVDYYTVYLLNRYSTPLSFSSMEKFLVVFYLNVNKKFLTKDNYAALTHDFTEYLDYMLLGKNIAEGNLYPKLLAEFCTKDQLDFCESIVETLRVAFPNKEFQYILLPRQNDDFEPVYYLMNIGKSGYAPIYFNVAKKTFNDFDNLDNCIHELEKIDFTILGQKIFILFVFDGLSNTDVFDCDEGRDHLFFADDFRIELSRCINHILFDAPLYIYNQFDRISKNWYTLLRHPHPQEDNLGKILDEYQPKKIPARGEQNLDNYVKRLRCKYPEIEFKYIVLPMTEYIRTNIILNLEIP